MDDKRPVYSKGWTIKLGDKELKRNCNGDWVAVTELDEYCSVCELPLSANSYIVEYSDPGLKDSVVCPSCLAYLQTNPHSLYTISKIFLRLKTVSYEDSVIYKEGKK